MIDESVVKRLAVQRGTQNALPKGGDWCVSFTEKRLVEFANAIAAHQREIDAEICENFGGFKDGYSCAEEIRKQGEVK